MDFGAFVFKGFWRKRKRERERESAGGREGGRGRGGREGGRERESLGFSG